MRHKNCAAAKGNAFKCAFKYKCGKNLLQSGNIALQFQKFLGKLLDKICCKNFHCAPFYFAVAKDLARLTKNNDKSRIGRRHSITLCESRHRKVSTESNASSSNASNSGTSSGQSSKKSSLNRASPPKEFQSLNVTAIEENSNDSCFGDFDQAPKPLKTLDLRLEEVAHIRSVLTKAELEAMPLDSTLRDNVARGKVKRLRELLNKVAS